MCNRRGAIDKLNAFFLSVVLFPMNFVIIVNNYNFLSFKAETHQTHLFTYVEFTKERQNEESEIINVEDDASSSSESSSQIKRVAQ